MKKLKLKGFLQTRVYKKTEKNFKKHANNKGLDSSELLRKLIDNELRAYKP